MSDRVKPSPSQTDPTRAVAANSEPQQTGSQEWLAAWPLPLRDSFIAAIVCLRGYRIVTRDAATFERMGCKVVDPWK